MTDFTDIKSIGSNGCDKFWGFTNQASIILLRRLDNLIVSGKKNQGD